ncbi:hypothetical protein MUY27_16010 [Mucilaginibacter sp. RS28]|uniref:Uncharacterized protein n=1 Tax=Mucilaginibacter straminoryzae TaxID=2932774 RepID=A0A9X1X5B9_9SPHI|nr:hypothetical protein [Mucilaginibacter straminoryzae]MCJ8211223.1 hypothetical protein [Mucilaginibacter straminoryzae]
MIIIDKKAEILSFKLQQDLDLPESDIHCSSASGYHWNTAPDATHAFTYNLTYDAANPLDNISFMECISRLKLIVKLDAPHVDAITVTQQIQEFDEFVKTYILENAPEFAPKLKFYSTINTENALARLEKNIAEATTLKPFEQKTEQEKEIDSSIENLTMTNFKTIKEHSIIEEKDPTIRTTRFTITMEEKYLKKE